MREEIKQETAHAWATIKRSSSKDQGVGYEFGYSDPTGDIDQVAAALTVLKEQVLKIVGSM